MAALFLAIVLIGIAGLIAAADIATAQTSRSKTEALAHGGSHKAEALLRILNRIEHVHETLVFTRLLAIQGLAVLISMVVVNWVGSAWLWLILPGVTVVTYMVGSAIAGGLLVRGSDAVALGFARWIIRLDFVLTPIVRIVGAPLRWMDRGEEPTGVDVREVLDQVGAGEEIEEVEAKMLQSLFAFADAIVRDVMVPRPDMVCLSIDDTIDVALTVAVESGYSRIPVEREGIDDIAGLLYVKDLLARSPESATSRSIAEMIRPATYVPEQKRTSHLLSDMRTEKFHLAIVIDEYGGTAGLVTLEDLLEELVGEIEDEYDPVTESVIYQGYGLYRIIGRFTLSDLEDIVDAKFDIDGASTVGGAMLALMGRIPERGESVTDPETGVEFRALRVVGHRIEEVEVRENGTDDRRGADRELGGRDECSDIDPAGRRSL